MKASKSLFRDIFKKTQIKHTTGAESRHWLSRPDMIYWPQQLNFALWCATAGCGISSRILFDHDTDHEIEALKTGPLVHEIPRLFYGEAYFE